jgi:uncharacterized protein DUF5994
MTRHDAGLESTPRLRLKTKAPISGHVDGAWWPRTNELTTELPDLLAVLSVRLGSVDQVLYNLAEWAAMPKRIVTGGRAVRLDGHRLQPSNTVQVLGLGRQKILLLVVEPHADPEIAEEAMMTAAAPNDATAVGELLTSGAHAEDAADGSHRWAFRRHRRRNRRRRPA